VEPPPLRPATDLPQHPSELELHAHLMGALPAERAAYVHEHAATCVRCNEVRAELHAAHLAFDRHVLPRTREAIEERAGARRRHRRLRWLWAAAVPLAGAVAASIVLWPGPEAPSPAGDLGIKGGAVAVPAMVASADLEVLASRAPEGGPGPGPRAWAAVTPGSPRLRAGDEIRFVLRRPAGLGHVLVVAVAAGGAVSVYHPYDGATSAPLDSGAARVELRNTVVLDAAPGPERVFAFFGRAPVPLALVQPALAELGRRGADALRTTPVVKVPVEAQGSVLLEKEPRP
jgi:hypothetical protein